MTSKFEQLIEYVINDEEGKARELFHDIVVEKSREIYENLMNEEELDEAESCDEELDESAVEDEEDLEESLGGDASKDLIDDVEMEEEGMSEGEEDEGEGEFDAEEGEGEDLEDRVVDLEDKLDELMAEFEAMMGSDTDDEMDSDDVDFGVDGGDELEMDDTEEFTDENVGFMESVDLKAAPAPVKSEEGSINKKSTVAANSGANGAVAKPVTTTGGEAKGRPAPTTKDLIGDFQNKAGSSMKDQKSAPKPVTTQAAGVNAKTPFPKG